MGMEAAACSHSQRCLPCIALRHAPLSEEPARSAVPFFFGLARQASDFASWARDIDAQQRMGELQGRGYSYYR